jgi:hypothetical protein
MSYSDLERVLIESEMVKLRQEGDMIEIWPLKELKWNTDSSVQWDLPQQSGDKSSRNPTEHQWSTRSKTRLTGGGDNSHYYDWPGDGIDSKWLGPPGGSPYLGVLTKSKALSKIAPKLPIKLHRCEGFAHMGKATFTLWETGGDGNCFFSSFAFAYYGDRNLHGEVRRQIRNMWHQATIPGTTMYRQREAVYKLLQRQYLFLHEGNANAYINTPEQIINTEGAWANECILPLVADAYNVTLFLWSLDDPDDSGRFHIAWIAGSSDPATAETQEQIHLIHVNDNHFRALIQSEVELPKARFKAHLPYLRAPRNSAQYDGQEPGWGAYNMWYKPTSWGASFGDNVTEDGFLPDLGWRVGCGRGPKWPQDD